MSKLNEFLSQCGVLDVESTSPDPKTCEIIELAFGIYDKNDWCTISNHYKPTIEIPPESAEKHFITDEMVANSPSFVASHTDHGFGVYVDAMRYFVAHNAQYDRTAILSNYDRLGVEYSDKLANKANWICTYNLAKKIFNNENALPAYRLGVLWFYFKLYQGVTRTIIPHQADSDIYMAGKLLAYLVGILVELGEVDDTQDIGPQVKAFMDKPTVVTHWPFGKHKGVAIKDVPQDYLNWAITNMDMFNEEHDNYDADLSFSVCNVMESRL